MEPRVAYKDVQIEDNLYRINKMDARLSCWMFTTLGRRATSSGLLLSALGTCSREEFNELQSLALAVVQRMELRDGVQLPVPILSAAGAVADKFLADKPDFLLRLTSESIMLSIAPFLVDDKSNEPQ
jgi:hypothetical protein